MPFAIGSAGLKQKAKKDSGDFIRLHRLASGLLPAATQIDQRTFTEICVIADTDGEEKASFAERPLELISVMPSGPANSFLMTVSDEIERRAGVLGGK